MKKDKRIGRFVCFLFALLLSTILLLAWAGAAAAAPARTDSYAIPLFLFPKETVLRNPNGGAVSFLQLEPGSTVEGTAVFDLWYSYSPIVIPDISTMTVSVNGTPLDSRTLQAEQAARSNWKVNIPGRLFVPGVNEIEVSVVHRTIDGLCRDIDNDANWFVIRPETRLNFVLGRGAYRLSSFPQPFTDPYDASKTNTVVYLPTGHDNATFSAALNLATLLGQESGPGDFPRKLEVRVGPPGQGGTNEIVFERTEAAEAAGEPAPVLTFQALPNGYSRLIVEAKSGSGFAKAVEALRRPQIVRTLGVGPATLSSPLPATRTEGGAWPFKDKKEKYALADFGYDDITVAGAFHQDAYVQIPRPPNYKAGDGSYIELHFRHSKILDPNKSAVTIYVNDIPVREVALLQENAERGVLKAPIPISELNNPTWSIRFGFYHDLGIVDCSKRYNEVAWSVIEKSSVVYLKGGDIPYVPAWEHFPSDFFQGPGGQVDLTLLVTGAKSAPNLSTAFKLAYYIGLHNHSDIRWQARDAQGFDAGKTPGTVLALGRNNDVGGWESLQKYLPIYPMQGGYRIADWLETAKDSMGQFDIYQIGRVNGEKWVYAFMVGEENRLNDLIVSLYRGDMRLEGQVSLVDDNGTVTSFRQREATPVKSLAWLDSIMVGMDMTTFTYAAALLVVVVVTVLVTISARRRRQ